MALMAIVWSLFAPKGLTVDSFSLLVMSGPVLLVTTSTLWRSRRLVALSSTRRARFSAEAQEAA